MVTDAGGLVQFPFVVTSVQVPGVVITMEGLVEPVDHVFPVVLPEVKVTFPPGHNVMDEAVMEAVKLLASKQKTPSVYRH